MTAHNEPTWLVDLSKAADGLITLPENAEDTVNAAVTTMKTVPLDDLSAEHLMQALRAVRRIQDNLALSHRTKDAFRAFIRNKSNQREDGSLMTYQEIAEVFGNYYTHMTFCNWMRRFFPDVAKAMREQHV